MQQRKLYLDSSHQIFQSSQSQSKETDCLFKLVCIKYKDRHTYEVKYLHRCFICVKYLFLYYMVTFIFIGFKIATKKKEKSLVFRVLETLLGQPIKLHMTTKMFCFLIKNKKTFVVLFSFQFMLVVISLGAPDRFTCTVQRWKFSRSYIIVGFFFLLTFHLHSFPVCRRGKRHS